MISTRLGGACDVTVGVWVIPFPSPAWAQTECIPGIAPASPPACIADDHALPAAAGKLPAPAICGSESHPHPPESAAAPASDPAERSSWTPWPRNVKDPVGQFAEGFCP